MCSLKIKKIEYYKYIAKGYFINIQFIIKYNEQDFTYPFLGCSIKVKDKIYDFPGKTITKTNIKDELNIDITDIKETLINNNFKIKIALWENNKFLKRICDSGWVSFQALSDLE